MAATLERLHKPRWKHVEKAADELTALYSVPPIPAHEIAELSGVDVVFASFGSSNEKVAGFCDFANAKLYVNATDPTVRQTFTIAHELGHWVLHKKYFDAHPDEYDILPRYQTPYENDAFEKEANFFAASLLVPKRLLKPVIDAPISSLASAFGVSRTMMEYRLKNVR
jgi:Zn-dependent peptidase ImmA (M78 family)